MHRRLLPLLQHLEPAAGTKVGCQLPKRPVFEVEFCNSKCNALAGREHKGLLSDTSELAQSKLEHFITRIALCTRMLVLARADT